jgi:hypothetical protein
MKKLFILLGVICLTQISFAQHRFGIRGGLNIANQKVTVSAFGDKISQSGDAIPSFHIGGMGDIQLSELFYLQPSILLSGKGMNLDGEDDFGNPIEVKVRPFYLELPVNLVVKTQLPSTNLSIYGGAGPSIGFGVFGKVKGGGEDEDAFQEEGFKRLDFGVNLTAGVETQTGWQFSFHFTPGIANIYGGEDVGGGEDITWKNKVVGFSIGYFFSQNK